MPMKVIDRSLSYGTPERYYVNPTASSLKLGEEFVVQTATCCQPVVRSKEDVLPENFIEWKETGPIFIEGIKAGEMIRIDIKKIKIIGHGSGYRYNSWDIWTSMDR